MDIEDLIWGDPERTVEVKVYVYTEPGVHQIHSLAKSPLSNLVEIGLEQHEVVSYWTIPTRANMEEYRRKAATFNFQTGALLVDEFVLSDCVVAGHIRTLFVDAKEVPLECDENGKLGTESLNKLKTIHSGLYDILYDKYRMEACLF